MADGVVEDVPDNLSEPPLIALHDEILVGHVHLPCQTVTFDTGAESKDDLACRRLEMHTLVGHPITRQLRIGEATQVLHERNESRELAVCLLQACRGRRNDPIAHTLD